MQHVAEILQEVLDQVAEHSESESIQLEGESEQEEAEATELQSIFA